MHFALVDQAALRLVHEFDRVFDGENVVGTVVIAVVDHARERGGLARTRGAGNEHQAARQHAQVAEDLRRAEIIQVDDVRGNAAENGARAAVLVEGIDAKPRQLRNFEGEIGFEELFEGLALLVVHDVVHHAVHFLVGKRRHVDPFHVAIDADHRRHAG